MSSVVSGKTGATKEAQAELHDFLKRYSDRCWDHHKVYKEAQEKLLYFMATIFTLVVSASGIFGATTNKNLSFTAEHIGLFHVLFLIVWLFFLYKKLNSDMYVRIARATDEYRNRCFPQKKLIGLPNFSDIKTDFLGQSNSLTTGRSFANYAGIMIMLTYLALCVMAVTSGSLINDQGIHIEWAQMYVVAPFAVVFVLVQLLFARQNKLLGQRIKDKWDVLPCPV